MLKIKINQGESNVQVSGPLYDLLPEFGCSILAFYNGMINEMTESERKLFDELFINTVATSMVMTVGSPPNTNCTPIGESVKIDSNVIDLMKNFKKEKEQDEYDN